MYTFSYFWWCFYLFSMGLGELVCRLFLFGDVVVYLYQLVDVAFVS